MIGIKQKAKKPAGTPDHVHVFTNAATGRDWHVELEWREHGQGDTAQVLVVQVFEPDGTMHDGSLSYSVNHAELASPDFDADAKVLELIAGRIERSETIRASTAKLAAARGRFVGKPSAAAERLGILSPV